MSAAPPPMKGRSNSISQQRASQSVAQIVFHMGEDRNDDAGNGGVGDQEIVVPPTTAIPVTATSQSRSSVSMIPNQLDKNNNTHSSDVSEDIFAEEKKKGAIELMVNGVAVAVDATAEKKKKKVYYDNASFLSKITFSWMNRVLARGRADKLREEDLRLPQSLRTEEAYQEFMGCWNKERENEYPSLVKALWKFSKRQFLITGFFKLLWSALLILCAYYLVRSLVSFVSEKKDDVNRSADSMGPGLSLAFLGATIALSVAQHQMNHQATQLGIKVRGALMTAVFRKSLKMENVSKHSAYILNLITNDCNRLMEACLASHSLYSAPLEAFTIIALLIVLTGTIAIIALGLLLFIVPLQYYIGKRIAYLRNKNIAATDKRVNLMHEVLMAIKLVKFYSWESSFMEDVKELRQAEIRAIEKGNLIKTINLMTVFWIPPIIALAVFSLYVSIHGELAATIAFTTLSLFNTLRFPLVILPKALKNFAESNAAVRRIEQLLLQPELTLLREGVQPKHMKKGKDIIAYVDKTDVASSQREVSLTKTESTIKQIYDEEEKEIIISFQKVTIGYIQNLAEVKKKSKKNKHARRLSGAEHATTTQETQAERVAREKQEDEDEQEEEKEQEKQVEKLKRASSLVHQQHPDADNLSVPVLRNVSFELEKGMKLCIAGPVASGKSSLLQAILGEARVMAGRVHTHGTIGFVPQFPWIQSGTVRDNITFGKPWDEQKYKQVVFACALEHDLAILPNGDQTFIAERGMNLSGGQRQRISIARAAYSDHEVMVLDSPLSAVDYHTGQHIINHCFNGLMAGKTIVLVTHQLHLLHQFDRVAIIKNNHLVYFGPYRRDIVKREFPLFEEEGDEQQPEEPTETAQRQTSTEAQKKLDAVEEQKISDAADKGEVITTGVSSVSLSNPVPAAAVVSARMAREEAKKKTNTKIENLGAWKAFLIWVSEGGNWWFILAMSVAAFTQTSRIFSDWWVSRWSGGDFNLNNTQYNWIYSILVFTFFVFLNFRGLSFYYFAVRSATSIHNKMFQTVLRAPMYFFSRSPLGGVIDAFSGDQDTIDQALPDTFHITVVFGYILFTTIILVSVILPLYSLVLVLLILSFAVVASYYLKTAMVIKGLVAKTSSPVVSHISESLEGINVLRAFGSTDRFQELSVAFINRSHCALFNLEQLQLWLAFRLDLVACLLVFATSLLCTLTRDSLAPSTAGLAISSSMQKLVFYAWVVRGMADIISLVSAVDHINYYTRTIDQEDEFVKEKRPEKNWPQTGNITFDNVSLNYFPGGPLTLKNVSFTIKAREKIGVIGRTGSGKSTLVMALFRLIECLQGRIIVDGQVLKDFGLTDVRSKFAIIPQEPVMFRGTVRTNLDPFNEYSDEEVWKALELAHLKDSMEANGQNLDMPVDQGGGNFSLGQKQLVCLARALLKKTPILVLDEATAAMDLETDQLIQKTIKTAFADRTVITIAHRLDTIIQSDKILGMSSGELVEFDTPRNLLSNPDSFFSQLVARAGKHSESLKKTVFGSDYVHPPTPQLKPRKAAAANTDSKQPESKL